MASLMYREDGRWRRVERLDTVSGGSLVGMPDLDPDEVRSQVDSVTDEDETSSNETATTSNVSPEDWKLKQSPSKYLANTPKGPQAKLAQQLVDAGLGDMTVEDLEEDKEEDES